MDRAQERSASQIDQEWELDGVIEGKCLACGKSRLLMEPATSRHRLGDEAICYRCHREACSGGGLCPRCDALG